VHVILVFVLVEVFDATGTMIGVATRAGLIQEGRPNRLGRALLADSTAIVAGSFLGTSSTTAYVESASGVQAGGRTGLTALTIAVLFLLSLFLAPLAGAVPAYATAPALLYVAGLMLREAVHIEWGDITESTPAALTAMVMPFTYSIANGLAFGFISYVVLKACWRSFPRPARLVQSEYTGIITIRNRRLHRPPFYCKDTHEHHRPGQRQLSVRH
jgi:AGZA family xanthine/uracil permease-like MFS transporter